MNYKNLVKLDSIVLGLLFLFPVAGTFVRHWISDIYVLLFVVAMYFVFRREKQNIVKEEIVWLWVLAAYFFVFIFTSLVNGWTERQTDWVLLELRFIGVIPIYLMLRRYPQAGRVLLYGCAVGLVANMVWGTYEIYFQVKDTSVNYFQGRLTGIYGPLFIGPVVLLMSALLVPGTLIIDKFREHWIWIGLIILFGIYLTIESETRSAYLALVVLLFLVPLYYNQGKKVLIGAVLSSFLLVGVYYLSSAVQNRVNVTIQNVTAYFEQDNKAESETIETPVGIRLEMWRATQYFFKDAPLFGVGRGNYNIAMQKYIDAGLVNPVVNEHSHPHNAYIETLMSRGILGLSVMLLLLYYPLYVFIKTRKSSPHTALLGIIHIVSISIFSLTETAAFIKGNFVAVNLVFMAVILSFHLRSIGRIT